MPWAWLCVRKMIEINLLPEELRNRAAKVNKPETVVASSKGLGPQYFILLIPLIFAFLICAQLIVAMMSIARSASINILNKQFKRLEPERKTLDEFNNKYTLISDDAQAMQQLMRDRIAWSEKLNKLSLQLPSGVWFSELSVNSKELILKGAVISLNKEELNLIKLLIDNLKNDPVFFKDFSTLELASAERKTIGSYDITEFILNATLKAK